MIASSPSIALPRGSGLQPSHPGTPGVAYGTLESSGDARNQLVIEVVIAHAQDHPGHSYPAQPGAAGDNMRGGRTGGGRGNLVRPRLPEPAHPACDAAP